MYVDGKPKPLVEWRKDNEGYLLGTATIPTVAGLVGKRLPHAELSIAVSSIKTSKELGCLLAYSLIAQNLAALRALSTPGGIKEQHDDKFAKKVDL